MYKACFWDHARDGLLVYFGLVREDHEPRIEDNLNHGCVSISICGGDEDNVKGKGDALKSQRRNEIRLFAKPIAVNRRNGILTGKRIWHPSTTVSGKMTAHAFPVSCHW